MLTLTVLALVYAGLTLARMALALDFLRHARALDATAADGSELTILQPILSGDPTLESCLEANLRNMPRARFLWLIDEDDAEGRRIAARHAATANLRVVLLPPPADGENPKVAKLAAALPLVETRCYAVLDDDTVLPPGAAQAALHALGDSDLVTGLPCYASRTSAWSRLVTGFVNGSALITFPPAAVMRRQRTINGMFYAGDCAQLRAVGGFECIRHELTDDYAIAKLYEANGLRIRQSAIVHPIRTHVRDAAHYFSLMRRWMIFANRYVRENIGAFTLLVIGAPTFLPPVLLAIAVTHGSGAVVAVLALLFAKAALMAALRARFDAETPRLADLPFEVLADLLTPLHVAAACVAPTRFRWRTRRIRLRDESIHYERGA